MNFRIIVLAIVLLGEFYFGWSPVADRTTWVLENFPVFILVPILIWLQPRIKLSNFAISILALHAFVLMLGGHYTYAKVPLGFWMEDFFHLGRNHYDRIGHFMQGFAPAVVLSEILVKKSPLKPGMLLNLTVISMCLAFSAFYELVEWWSALILGQGAEAFLGTQGDVWDTQWDMFMALVGSSVAIGLIYVHRCGFTEGTKGSPHI